MRKAIWTTLSLTALASGIALWFGRSSLCGSLWIGAVWGVVNFWVIQKAAQTAFSGQGKLRLVGWLLVKFVVLYGALIWLLVGARISAVGFIGGFSASLAGLMLAALPTLKPLLTKTSQSLVFIGMMGISGLCFASEAATGAAVPHPPEIPNLITVITHFGDGPIVHFLHTWENSIYALLIAGMVGGLIVLGSRAMAMLPGRGQTAVEAVVEALDGMVCGVLGKKEGRRYLPFVGTLFLYILAMNLAGLVPGLKSPTSRFEMTAALALCVFCFVQWTGVSRLGVIGYVDHLLGEPRDFMGWLFSPVMLFIHLIGEIVKPISLSLRLFGNIMGEDTLLGVFVLLGALTMAWSHLPVGLPLHFPFVLLAILFSLVQALVFTMLTTIYISMMLPHETHEEAVASSQGH